MPDRPIHRRIAAHVRGPAVGYVAIFLLALGVGGGYALASSKTKTITVCADKKTGVLHLKTRGRCKSSQARVSWNQQGPQGVRGPQGTAGARGATGAQGAQGPQGAAAVSVWANVTDSGSVLAGQGVSVQRVSAGTYQVTITDPACAHGSNAPVVSVSDSNPPAGQSAGAFPVAWYGATGANQQFTVFTGVVAAGSFTATDHTFDVQDSCQ
ncbi:MAG: collagen-like triple helix repeat-containing protein [Solirubrobacteraceae bacterium]